MPDTKAGDPSVKPTDAKPTDAMPTTDAKPADTTAKPADATPAAAAADDSTKCKDAPKPKSKTKTKKACMTECSKLEATAPAGSKCVPPKTACEEQCKTLKGSESSEWGECLGTTVRGRSRRMSRAHFSTQ